MYVCTIKIPKNTKKNERILEVFLAIDCSYDTRVIHFFYKNIGCKNVQDGIGQTFKIMLRILSS